MVTGIAKLLLQQSLKQGSKRFAQPLRGAYGSNPYFKNYVDMMTGQQGWKKGAAAWYGTDLALDTVSDVAELGLPERVQEDIVEAIVIPAEELGPPKFPKDGPVDMPPDVVKKPKIIDTPDKKDTSNKKILEEELLTPKDFFIKDFQELSVEGGFRNASINYDNFSIDKDLVKFQLSRGSYATIVIREILKPDDPLSCGF